MKRSILAFATAALASSLVASAQDNQQPQATTQDPDAHQSAQIGRVFQTPVVEPTDELISRLTIPNGFRVSKFAQDLPNPRVIEVASDGTVYVTSRETGQVFLLRDTDRDGVADQQSVVMRQPGLHGITLSPDEQKMYFVTIRELFVADRNRDGTLSAPTLIFNDLPDAGQHPNRTLSFGPDGKLYLSVGSTTNAANEPNPENATILKVDVSVPSRVIYAQGLRNTIGFDWHPTTGELWGFDHGIDWLGDDVHQEELNKIEEGNHYGWPIVFEDGKYNLQPPPPNRMTREQFAAMTTGYVMGYTPHAAPMEMEFYNATQFPPEFRGDAFVAMRGSWNRYPPSGYEIVRVDFEAGQPRSIEPFVSGFLFEQDGDYKTFARLMGLAVHTDGSILFGDDKNGVIYRISYSQ